MIELINVCKSYKNKVVIKNFNYKFNDFGLYFLVGKSGSGKTTLLNLITQMIEPSSGNIIYSNLDSIYKDTYYAYQDFNLFSSLTVLENIRMLANIKKIEINDELIDNTLNELNIFELKDSKANEISGGERQRLSIAIALILKTKVLILDEPTANLDDNNAHNLMDIVRKLANSILIIVSTHDKSLLNENDSIIDMQNISKELVESENIAKSTEKRINLGKSVFGIKNKLIHKQWFRFVLQTIIMAVVIALATFIIPVSQVTKDRTYSDQITKSNHYLYLGSHGGISGCLEKEYLDFKYDKLNQATIYYGREILACDLLDGERTKFITIAEYLCIDNSLAENEINISKKIQNRMIENGILSNEDDYDFVYHNKTYKIQGINTYEVYKNDIGETIYMDDIIFMSYQTFINLCDFQSIGISTIYEKNYYIQKSDTINDGHVILSKEFLELRKETFFDKTEYKVGDTIRIKTINNDFVPFKDFIIDDIVEDGNCYMSYNDILYLSEPILEDGYISTYFFGNLYDKKSTAELIKYLEDNNINYYFPSIDTVKYYTSYFQGLTSMLSGFIPILSLVSLVISFYMIHTMMKENQKNFDILNLSGVSKKSIFSICLIDHVESIILASLLSIWPIIYFKNTIDKNVEEYMTEGNLVFKYEYFHIGYYIGSVLFVFVVFIGITYLMVLFRRRNKTFIN